MALCLHQKRELEACANGLSRKMTCLKGHGNTCVNQCQLHSCVNFTPIQREASKPQVNTSRGGGFAMPATNTSVSKPSGCGGCGSNKTLVATNMSVASTGNVSYKDGGENINYE